MQIQIVNAKVEHYPNLGRYFFAELRAGKHHASFAIGQNGIDVCVHNAANRVWRGLGKRFPSIEAARANYKTPAIVAMLDEVARLNLAEG